MKNFILLIMVALPGFFMLSAQNNMQEPGEKAEGISSDKSSALSFRNAGPSRGGRVTAVAGVPGDPGTYYMGATGGGVWKTIDYGFHWRNISDGYFESPSIGAIAVSETNPDIIYTGTGSDAIRSNVIVGKGMYKSLDAGETWTFSGLKDAGQIGSVIIHPNNHEIVFVAALGQPFRKSEQRGVFRSKDGGNSWENVLFLSDSVGAVDLEFAPGNPDIVYAAMWRAERKPWTIISGGAEDGIYKSVDGGDTWKRKVNGLPDALTGKIDLAVSAQMPGRVWAQIQTSEGQEGIYRSDDFGESFVKIELPEKIHKSIMYRPFYFTNITANPQNADHIFAGTKEFWTSYNGGKTWTQVPITHADHHDLWISPVDSLLMVEGNDGGASVSRDGGRNWSTVFNQPTAELYSCDVDDQFPYYLYSGQQDNSTIRVPSRRPDLNVLSSNDNHGFDDVIFWERLGGCETGPVVPKPGDPNIVYSNCKGQFSVYYHDVGEEFLYYVGAESLYGNHPSDIKYRFQRVTPIEVSPHDPNVVYYGSQYVHKTENGGKVWETISPDLTANLEEYNIRGGGPIDEDISGEEYYAVIYAIEESPLEIGVIWTGSNDGLFYVTRDGGKTWQNVTPDMPPGGRVSNIEASPHKKGKAYYAVYRDYLGDDSPYIYATEDYGKTWKKLSDSNGIPSDFPTRVVREDPRREGLLYAGTEFGLYISFDDGKKWRSFQQNLPVVPVTDIRIIRDDLVLSTLGRSFWIMDDISPLREYNPEKQYDFHLYKPRDIYYDEQRIHFHLPKNKDTNDSIALTFSRNDQQIHSIKKPVSKIDTDEWGISYLEWDLRYHITNGIDTIKGPFAAPGKYNVSLVYGDNRLDQEFTYLINPEWESIGITHDDLNEQESLALKVSELLLEIKYKMSQLEKQLSETDSESEKKIITEKLNRLKTGPRRYDQPMLYEHTEYLFDILTHTLQKPGMDVYQRYDELKEAWELYF